MNARFTLMPALLLVSAAVVAGQPPKTEPAEEPKRLNKAIEDSVKWYDVVPDEGAAALEPVVVLRWRNVVRGQEGEAMMVVWPHAGRPVAITSIYPWAGKMTHEFDSLARGKQKLTAREKDRVIWSPEEPGVEFKDMPKAPAPAKTAAERLRQMKAIAAEFKATMTGWAGDNSDQELLRLLTRELHRYKLVNEKDADPKLIDGGLFAYATGTDPEVVLVLEAIATAEKAAWQYAFVRATSGGLEVKLGDEIVWSAKKHPASRVPTLPHFSIQRALEK